jgi:hypothetical protein
MKEDCHFRDTAHCIQWFVADAMRLDEDFS